METAVAAPAAVEAPVESGAEAVEGGEGDAPESLAQVAKAAEVAQKKKYKLKVYDKEEEVDEDEVVRRAQRASAADEKFKKAADTEKRFSSMVEHLKSNPWELFRALNMDPHQAAEQLLIEKLKIETMTPEQRRAWDIQQENAQLKSRIEMSEKERADEAKRVEDELRSDLTSRTVETIDQSIVGAIREAGLKKPTPSLIRRVAQKMLAYHDANDGKLLEAPRALKSVLDDLQSEWMDALDALPESEYDARLPKGFTERLRKHHLSRVDSFGLQPKQSDSSKLKTTASSGKRLKTSTDSFFEHMEKRFK